MKSRYLVISFTLMLGMTASSSVASARTFKCQDKGSMNYGICKTLGGGKCSITVGDGTTVKMRCKELRRT